MPVKSKTSAPSYLQSQLGYGSFGSILGSACFYENEILDSASITKSLRLASFTKLDYTDNMAVLVETG